MRESLLQIPPAVLYGLDSEELLVAQLDTDQLFQFNASTKILLDHFKGRRTLASFIDAMGLGKRLEEIAYLRDFCRVLVRDRILSPITGIPATAWAPSVAYCRPALLRREYGFLKGMDVRRGLVTS